jgi:insulysin
LKARGLALKLSCGPDHEMNTFSTLDVSISLSEKGIKEYETVIEATFQYLQKLKEVGPQEWVFEEVRDIGITNFEF